LVNLELFSISDNLITRLPDSFCNLKILKKLFWGLTCHLESFPTCFPELTSLEHLNFGECNKLRPPVYVGEMENLKYINLHIESGENKGEIDDMFLWGGM